MSLDSRLIQENMQEDLKELCSLLDLHLLPPAQADYTEKILSLAQHRGCAIGMRLAVSAFLSAQTFKEIK